MHLPCYTNRCFKQLWNSFINSLMIRQTLWISSTFFWLFIVSCPVAYLHNTSDCQACAVDHYQDKEVQTSCVPCPFGTSTFGELAWQGNCEGLYDEFICTAVNNIRIWPLANSYLHQKFQNIKCRWARDIRSPSQCHHCHGNSCTSHCNSCCRHLFCVEAKNVSQKHRFFLWLSLSSP